MGRIFFIAKDPKQASIDLYDCCLNLPYSDSPSLSKCAKTSVHFSLCTCFHSFKYTAAVASEFQIEYLKNKPNINIPGIVWIMHHWSVDKHPDHFGMKVMELLALNANRNHPEALKSCCYSSMPDKIDAIFSMDYYFKDFTDYESFLLDLLFRSMGYTVPLHSLVNGDDRPELREALYSSAHLRASLKMESFCPYIDYINNEHPYLKDVNCSDIIKNPSFPKLKFVHMDIAYINPLYKNNIPEPAHLSVETLDLTLKSILTIAKSNYFVVAILQRNEGNGNRIFVNIDDLMRSINRILNVETVHIWYINSKTPALEQVRYFRSFDLLISPHSSQLANLVFSRPGSHVIEIQTVEERTFHLLGLKMGLHYQYLSDNEPVNRVSKDDNNWPKWNTKVNMTKFDEALENVNKIRLKS